jgi:hypothetical protein
MGFASDVFMPRLEALCAASIQLDHGAASWSGLGMGAKEPVAVPPARFDLDMRQAVNEPRHADVHFVSRQQGHQQEHHTPPGTAGSTALSAATPPSPSSLPSPSSPPSPPSPPSPNSVMSAPSLVGHKCVLAKIPFFKALLSETWREGQRPGQVLS